MNKETIDWKAKYKEAAQELEAYENDQTAQQLRQLATRLSVGVSGQSQALDDALNTLQPHLQPQQSTTRLPKSALDQVDRQIRALDQQRAASGQAILEAVSTWIRQLKSYLTMESSLSEALLTLERTAPVQLESTYQLPDVVAELVDLQGKLITEIAGGPSQDASTDIDLAPVEAELASLVDLLILSDAARQQANRIAARLREGLTLPVLVDALKEVVELARAAHTSTNEDFENYLINLNSQLAEVQSFLQESFSEQQVAGDAHRLLDQKVREDVGQIQSAVKSSIDLSELKQSVATQLAGIVEAMDEFRRNEEQRDTRMQERYDSLMARVAEMELETQRVKTHMEEERQKARTDSLTGLPNRAAYDDHMRKEFERWSRYQQGFSVAVGDLDYFKRINDTYGHLAGDKVLRLVARVLSRNLRSADFIARFGGEEFVVLMPSTKASEAQTGIDKLRAAIGKSPFNFHGKPVTITMSFGVTEIQAGDTPDQLFERADGALYQAKQEGRNRVCVA